MILNPLEAGYAAGTITPQNFAWGIYNFFCAKWNLNLNGAQAKATAQLAAAGLPTKPPVAPYTQTPISGL